MPEYDILNTNAVPSDPRFSATGSWGNLDMLGAYRNTSPI